MSYLNGYSLSRLTVARDMHLGEAGDADRLRIKILEDRFNPHPHVRLEEALDALQRRRFALILQGAQRRPPLGGKHNQGGKMLSQLYEYA